MPLTSLAIENIGPHLLGRIPSPYDARDYKLSTVSLDTTFAALLGSTANSHVKDWAAQVMPYLKALPTPVPAPTPPAPTPPAPAGNVLWSDLEKVLDQGQTGHCVGFGGAQWGNTLPVDDKFGNSDGHAIYYECKVLDKEPLAEDGSTVRTLAKALKARSRINLYAWASTIDEMVAFLKTKGAFIVGTDWTNDMFSPDPLGFVIPTGGVAGGHCYVIDGLESGDTVFDCLNSWGSGWGLSGRFKIRVSDFATLLASQGEALAAVELP